MAPVPAGWEPWQAAYRHGALFVLPPPGIAAPVDALRRRHDPRSASFFGAHVSLTSPLPRTPTRKDLTELAALAASVPAIEVDVGRPRTYAPHPGVAFEVGPAAELRALRDTLHSAELFRDVVHTRDDVPFHLTAAEFISLAESERLAAELDGPGLGRFRCTAVSWAAPDEAFSFSVRGTFALGV
jgi:2'-5' RNA ligase superfamily